MGQGQDPLEQLIEICTTMETRFAAHGIVPTKEAIVDALVAAHIPSLIASNDPSIEAAIEEVPHETPARRYSVRANPGVTDGAMATVSFRIPAAVKALFDERVAELKADETEPGIENQTDAGQDAITRWLLIEGK